MIAVSEGRHFEEALELHRQALLIRTMALQSDHPDRAQSLNNLAGLLAVKQVLAP